MPMSQPFRRGSPAMELAAGELSDMMPAQFAAVTKKTIRDRVLKLLDLFSKGDEWKRRM